MKHPIKRYLRTICLVLCLCAILGILTGRARAEDLASGVCGTHLTWRLDSEGTLTISGTGPMTFTENLIWGGKASSIRRLVIEDGVTSIEANAFFGCSQMESAVIPNSVRTIALGAFNACDGLKTVTMPGDAKYPATSYYDDPRCFAGCTALEELIFTSDVTDSFYYYYLDRNSASSVKRITVTGDASRIDSGTLAECNGLLELTLGDGVTEIGNSALSSCTHLETVRGGGAITVGDNVFSKKCPYIQAPGCVILGTSLLQYNDDGSTSCTVPDSVRRICAYAFQNNEVLESVTLPGDLEELGSHAFYCCTALKTAVIPGGIRELSPHAYANCEALEKVTLGEGLERVGNDAFSGCNNLKEAVLPKSLKALGNNAFNECANLKDLVLPEGLESLGGQCFQNCVSLEKLRLPESLTEVGGAAFRNCTALREADLGPNVASIGAETFRNCTALTHVEIPASVTSVGNKAFYCCTGLETLVLNAREAKYGSQIFTTEGTPEARCELVIGPQVRTLSSDLFADASHIRTVTVACDLDQTYDRLFTGMKGLEQAVFRGSAEALGNNVFYACSALRDVTLPQGLRTLGNHTFYGCSSLPRILLPDGLEAIGVSAFGACNALEEAVLPQSLREVGSSCFSNCTSLRQAILPDGVTVLGSGCFNDCKQLEGATAEGDVITYCGWAITMNSDGDKTLTIPDGVVGVIEGLVSQSSASKFDVLELPEGLQRIGVRAFRYMSGLTEVTLPSSLLWLGEQAFADCTKLARVNGSPASLTIEKDAFQNTPYLKGGDEFVLLGNTLLQYCGTGKEDVTVPDGVTEIAPKAFLGNKEVKRVRLPQGVTQIGEVAFSSCSALERIDLPDTLTEIGPNAFSYSGLTEITLPDSVTILPERIFASCGSLKSVQLGDGMKEIGKEAFHGCRSLETLSLPRSVERIETAALADTGLREIDLPAGTVLGGNVFQYSDLEKLTFDGAPVNYLWLVRTHGQTLRNTPLMKSITDSWYLEEPPASLYSTKALTSKIGRIYARRLIESGEVTNIGTAYDWMCANCGYTYSIGNHVSAADGPFFYGTASCNGVSLAMKAFLDELDIPNFIMTGMVTGTYGHVSHAWNEVWSSDRFYLVDASDTKKGDYSTYMVSNSKAHDGYSANGMNMKYEFNMNTLSAKEDACLSEYTPRTSSDQPLTFTRQEDGTYWVTACLNGVTEVTVPAEYQGAPVTGIGPRAFSGCPFLTRAQLPEGLQTIGAEAFKNCIGLEEITLPSTVTWLGRAVFEDCISLDRADLSQSKLEILPGGTFYRCISLWELSLPATLTDASGIKITSVGLLNSTDGTFTLNISGYSGTAAEEKANELGFPFRSLGKVYHPEDAVRLLLHETLGEEDWPLPCAAEALDVSGDGKTDRTDAAWLLFRRVLPEQTPLDTLCIAGYDSNEQMIGTLILKGEKDAQEHDLSTLKEAAELRFFFLDSQWRPLTRQVTVRPGTQ